MKRRVEITIDSQRIVAFRNPRLLFLDCANCAGESPMLTPDEAAAMAKVSTRIIYRRVEANSLHFREAADGSLLICLNSLSRDCQEDVSQ